MPSFSTAMGSRPTAPTASTWSGTLASRVTAAMARHGCTVPTSPFAAPRVTRQVSGRKARRTSSGEIRPSAATPTAVTSSPVLTRSRHGERTEVCSTALVTTWRPGPRKATPLMARLLASVAPLRNTTPSGRPPTRRPTFARAARRDSRASSPKL